jgi:hypothetical protein
MYMGSSGEVRGLVVESIELLKLVECRSKVLRVGEGHKLELKRCFGNLLTGQTAVVDDVGAR